jgi:putative ABC transport system permease protein
MWSDLRIRIRSLLRRRRAETDLRDELAFHLEQAIGRNLARGMSTGEARRQAQLELGGLEQIKEECRDARGVALVDDLVRDLRHATRRLRRDWRFSLAASVILALGIGANTAIFSAVNAALFRKQPFAEPERLVNIYQNVGEEGLPESTSYPAFLDVVEYSDLFAGVAATRFPAGVRYDAGDGVRPAVAEFATSAYLSVLGLRPTLGRWFDAQEDAPGPEAAAVLSHHSWRTKFGADRDILGRALRVNGVPVTVVGVGPQELNASLPIGIVTDMWLSIASVPSVSGRATDLTRNQRGGGFLVKARLRADVTVPQVKAAMDTLGERLAVEYPDQDAGKGFTVLTEDEVRIHPLLDEALAPGATVLLVSVALVLAIACSNLATLLLVRGASRSRELSLRLSLGATRAQVVRHLLAESVLLATPGGIAGCLIAAVGVRALGRLDLPLVMDLRLDFRVLAFTVALTLLTGLVVGLAPALGASRLDLLPALRDEGGAIAAKRRWLSLKNTLVVTQVVVSFLLLVGTSFLVRMLVSARAQDVGFAVQGVAMLETDARYAGYPSERAPVLLGELRERVAGLPGVQATALVVGTPLRVISSRLIETDSGGGKPLLSWLWAGPGVFETLEIPVLYGRTFDDHDRPGTPSVAVINESAAREYFGTVNAVGRRFRFEEETEDETDGWIEVVGIVSDTMTADLGETTRPLLFRSFAQEGRAPTTVLARTALAASSLVGAMQDELRAIDPALPVIQAKTMARQLDDSLRALEIAAAFLGGLGAVGLALASVGLYAVVGYAVSRRALEVGIRTSLGARASQVIWAISRDVAKLLAFAVATGTVLSLIAIIALRQTDLSKPAPGVHLNVPTVDAGTLPFVALLLLAVGVGAAFWPAHRAAKADPLKVLRHE